jgi:hypothetical protein
VHWWLLVHFSPFFASHGSARNHATRFSMFFNSSKKKVKNILWMFFVANVLRERFASWGWDGT